MWIALSIVLYLVISFVAYKFVFSKNKDYTKFEQIWFSVFWILLLPLWLIHFIYNKCKG